MRAAATTNTKTVLRATIYQAQKRCQFYKDGAKNKMLPDGQHSNDYFWLLVSRF